MKDVHPIVSNILIMFWVFTLVFAIMFLAIDIMIFTSLWLYFWIFDEKISLEEIKL